jgi:pimeloyl-ACP methyl ester carboxylesterase
VSEIASSPVEFTVSYFMSRRRVDLVGKSGNQTVKIASTNGVKVELHDLGGTGPNMLMSHANGFHGLCWKPVAANLLKRFHCWAHDHRGHGDTAAPKDWKVAWSGYAADATAAAKSLSQKGGIIGVGHSMGGATLLLTAMKNPGLFRGLLLYEPILFPDDVKRPANRPNLLAEGAARRKPSFKSFDDAIKNFSSKMPMSSFTPEALEAYVHGGFRKGDDGQVHLKCSPELEAENFRNPQIPQLWKKLPEIDIPVWVLSGHPEPFQPSGFAEAIADRLPHGNHIEYSDLDHFGPFVDPVRIARIVDTFADTLEP